RRESISSSTSSTYTFTSSLSNETISGRQLSTVWEFFIRGSTKSPGHFFAICKFCQAKWARGEPLKLEAHLALNCSKMEDEVQQVYLLCVAQRNDLDKELKKRKLNDEQSSLTRFFLYRSEGGLSEGQKNSIDNSLLKAFVVCGIAFSVVENSFFIDLFQNLCPDYQPPSSETLSE
ncbi:6145_t:CDS:1, partial [Ambispora gerdemannii]